MVLIGRIFAGLSHGIGYLTVLVHAGEIATPKLRGTFVSTVHMSIFIGVFIHTTFSFQTVDWSRDFMNFKINLWNGIVGFVYVLIGVPLMYFFHEESPVYYIKKQQSQKAQDLMMKLRRETELTDDARLDFEDLHRLVTEDLAEGEAICEPKNIRSMILMVCLRLAFICTFNMPVNLSWLEASSDGFTNGDNSSTALVLMSVRLPTLIMALLFIDSWRRILASISLGGAALIMLTLYISTVIEGISDNVSLMIWLAVLFQIFSALGVGLHADIYSTECFSSIKKPTSIALTVSVEYAVHILLVLYNFYSIISSVWVFAIMTGLLFSTIGLVIFLIPDTAEIPLIEAKNKFYKVPACSCQF